MLQLGGGGLELGITTGLQFLPMLLFGLVGGVIADRYPRRRVLVAANAALVVVGLVLGLLVLTGAVVVAHVHLLAFLLGTASAMENPARQSFVVVEMVGADDLPNAVGLNSASFNAARVVGPALAGAIIAATGSTAPVLLLNAVSYLAVIAALLAMRPAELVPSPRRARGPGQLREGLRYVGGRTDLVLVLVVVFVVGTFGPNFQLTSALMATEVFGKGAGEYGLLGSILAVGSLTGALLAARRGEPRLRFVVVAAVAFGVAEVVAGLMPTYVTFAVALVPMGLAALTVITAAYATFQLRAHPEMRGRVMALNMVVFFGGTPVGAPLIGTLAEAFGARWSLLVGGSVSAAAPLVAAAVLARRQHLVVSAQVRPRPRLRLLAQQVTDTAQQA